jgi:non-homologous end joining protein Ku
MTREQTIAKAYVIINKTGRFKQGIIEWNKKAEATKTWVTFKVHFQQAHKDFRETTDVTLEESELQRNNANLVQQVVDGMQQHMDQDNNRDDNAEMMLQMANSANRSTETQDQLRAHLQQMQQSMSLLQAQVSNQQCFNPNQQGFNPTQYQGG